MIMMGGDKKKLASVIVASAYSPEGAAERNEEAYKEKAGEVEGYEAEMLEVASEIMKAFKSVDVLALKDSLKAFFDLCEAQPHVEGEHIPGVE